MLSTRAGNCQNSLSPVRSVFVGSSLRQRTHTYNCDDRGGDQGQGEGEGGEEELGSLGEAHAAECRLTTLVCCCRQVMCSLCNINL